MRAQQQQRERQENSWASPADRFAIDCLLRKHGFEIAERIGKLEAVWYKRFRDADGRPTSLERVNGKPKRYTQRQALAGVPRMEIEQAAGRQRGYLEAKYS